MTMPDGNIDPPPLISASGGLCIPAPVKIVAVICPTVRLAPLAAIGEAILTAGGVHGDASGAKSSAGLGVIVGTHA